MAVSQEILNHAKVQYAKSTDRVVVVGSTIYLNPEDKFLNTLDEDIAVVYGAEFIKEEPIPTEAISKKSKKEEKPE